MTPENIPLAPITVPPIAVSAATLGKLAAPPEPAEKPASDTAPPALVLFGRDGRGRPHASSFTAAEAEGATCAAALMDLHSLVVTEEHRPLAAGLPAGRLFAGGKAFVPFTSAQKHQDLLAAAGLPDTPIPLKAAAKPAEAPPGPGGTSGSGDGPSGAGGGAKPPADKAGDVPWPINLGDVVLAKGDDEEGYYPAKVIATKANSFLVLLWIGYDLMEFTRHRHELGLLHPNAAAQGK